MRGRMGKTALALARVGCTNRPFYLIAVMPDSRLTGRHYLGNLIETIGNYDPIPNTRNEKLVAINFERLRYWIARGSQISISLQELLGLCGYLPIHPKTMLRASHLNDGGGAAMAGVGLDDDDDGRSVDGADDDDLPQIEAPA